MLKEIENAQIERKNLQESIRKYIDSRNGMMIDEKGNRIPTTRQGSAEGEEIAQQNLNEVNSKLATLEAAKSAYDDLFNGKINFKDEEIKTYIDNLNNDADNNKSNISNFPNIIKIFNNLSSNMKITSIDSINENDFNEIKIANKLYNEISDIQIEKSSDIFAENNRIAVCDPVYPVYVDTNVMAGRTGEFIKETESWSNVIYMPCTKATNFAPEIPKETPDIIYLCFPNNPTGSTITKDQLQEWVDYANKVGAVIIYDAAYEAYISEDNVPHTIYECDGAKTCAIELRSFSKNAGFTGTRLGFTVIPKELESNGTKLNALWARRHGTKFNGAPYIIQRAGEAVYSEEGKKQTKAQVAYYMNNAKVIMEGLKNAGFSVSGGVNAPYVWLETPKDMTSWEFFDYLLNNANIVGTPGSGFGPSGEGYFRLTAFGTHENTLKAIERIKNL